MGSLLETLRRYAITTWATIRQAGVGKFLRFGVVGGTGFCVDALILAALTRYAGLGALLARLISFSIALCVTYELNRAWAFRHPLDRDYLANLRTYVVVQGFGALINFGVFAGLYLVLPPPLDAPIFCLAVASGVAMLVNYTGIVSLVFPSTAETR